jgi:hypothetical protein
MNTSISIRAAAPGALNDSYMALAGMGVPDGVVAALNSVELTDGPFDHLELWYSIEDGAIFVLDPLLPEEFNTGRLWVVRDDATEHEVVQTMLRAVLDWSEHEVRESFRYKGKAVFGPHQDLEQLLAVV